MRKLKNILILGGGDSTRFWPLTDKVIFPFLGRFLIEYIIEQVYPYASSIIVVAHPTIEKKIKKIVDQKVKVLLQKETSLGMAGAVLAAKNVIKNEEVLILNGSDLLEFSFLTDFIKKVRAGKKLVVAAKEVKNYFPGGYLKFNQNGQLMEILEKPKILPSPFYKLVVDYFYDFGVFLEKILKLKKIIKDDCLYEEGLNLAIKELKEVGVFYYQKDFYSLKYPWHVLSLTCYFLKAIKKNYFGKNVSISKKAIIIEPVYLCDGVKVGDYAKIVGPTFVGRNTFIADYTLVNNSHIGEDCLIGGYSEVTRSYLGNKVFLHRNYVGDSVIADNVLIGAEAVVANFRFDGNKIKSEINKEKISTDFLKLGAIIGEGSKIGVNATLLPGVKIGKKTFIGPNQLVKEDIRDYKFFFNNKLRENIF